MCVFVRVSSDVTNTFNVHGMSLICNVRVYDLDTLTKGVLSIYIYIYI